MSEDKILAEDGSLKKKLVIKLTEYEGNRLLDLRFCYFNKKEAEWSRTRKGIMLNRENFVCARKTFDEKGEDILDWLGIGYVPEHVAKYSDEQKDAGEKNAYRSDRVTCSSAEQPRNPCLFDVQHRGAETEVSYNSNHPFFKRLQKTADNKEFENLIALLFASYNKAKQRLGNSSVTDSSLLFEQLEYEWSNYLKGYFPDEQ